MKKVVIMLNFLVLITSCNSKNDVSIETGLMANPLSKVTYLNGKLAFLNESHFDQTISQISQIEEIESVRSLIKKFDGFESNFYTYNNLTNDDFTKIIQNNTYDTYKTLLHLETSDGEKQIIRNIAYMPLAVLISKHGEVIIGKRLHKFFYDKVVVSSITNEFDDSNIVQEYNIIHGKGVNFTSNARPAANTKTCSPQYRFSGNERRLCGIYNYDLYYSPGISGKVFTTISTQHQTRSLGFIWTSSKISNISLTGTVNIDYSPVPINETGTNVSTVARYFPSVCIGLPNGSVNCGIGVMNSHSTTHTGLGLDGLLKSVNM